MPRFYLTAREYDALLKRQHGNCCVRGCNATGGLIAEHSSPNGDRMTLTHKVKMLRDMKAIAKMKRLNGTTMSQDERRKKYGAKLRGRGFEKRA